MGHRSTRTDSPLFLLDNQARQMPSLRKPHELRELDRWQRERNILAPLLQVRVRRNLECREMKQAMKPFLAKYMSVEQKGKNVKLIPYEVKSVRICITPCPFVEHPKPLVGSASCQACTSFRGLDKVNHQVACARRYY